MKFLSSKIFLVLISFIIGVIIGWFLWYLVYPNLHVNGYQVWTGSSNNSTQSSKTKTSTTYTSPTYSNGAYNTPSRNNSTKSTGY